MTNSSVAVVILIFGMLFSLLYFSGIAASPQAQDVSPKPRITSIDAINVMKSDLEERLGGHYADLGIYNTNEGFLGYNEIKIIEGGENLNSPMSLDFQQRGIDPGTPLKFRLFYVHPNGTITDIDSSTYTVTRQCSPPDDCVPSTEYASHAVGRLVYAFDILWHAKDGAQSGEFYMIDANTGEIVFSFISEKPEGHPSSIIEKYYGNRTGPLPAPGA